MKSRRRHSTSSDESAESADSAESDSDASSGSEASESGSSAPARRHKKHKRRADSSGSDSEETRRRAKKRKHKKKKKKHGKKRHREESAEEESSESEPEERKHKHKHKRKQSVSRSLSVEEVPVTHPERGHSRSGRLQSVVQGGRRSGSRDRSRSPQPAARYYDYRHNSGRESRSGSEPRGRHRVAGGSPAEVDRFYRGSSRDTSRQRHHHRYEEEERFERPSGGREYEQRPRRDDQHQHHYTHRSVKYEHEEEYHPRPHHDRGDHNGRSHGYAPPEARSHRGGEGPACLICGAVHGGRPCRAAPQRNYPQHDDRRAPIKRERERSERPPKEERQERRRPEREHSYDKGKSRDTARERSPRREVRTDASRERRPREPVKRETERRPEPKREEERRPERDDDKRKEKKSRFETADDGKTYSWGKTEVKKEDAPADKDKPNFGLSGKLAADTNTVNGIVLKYSEPQDAKQPKRRWRFYPFKGDKALPILYIHRQSCFILGREHRAVDIPLEHPSISKQHAALQYRATPYTRPDGTQARRVRPYIIDLDSANGTFVNNKKIEPRRFVELLERDVVKFGFSQREYVLLHENSKDDAADDDQEMGGATEPAVTSIAAVKREKQIKQERADDV